MVLRTEALVKKAYFQIFAAILSAVFNNEVEVVFVLHI